MPGTILIVDEDLLLLSLIGQFLVQRGFSVLAAGSDEEAIQLANEHQPRILLADIGAAVTEHLQALDPGIGIIFTTHDPVPRRAHVNGVRVLGKPLNFGVLLEAIQSLFDAKETAGE